MDAFPRASTFAAILAAAWALVVLTSCHIPREATMVFESAREVVTEGQEGPCIGINTLGIGTLGTFHPPPAGMVLAGFITNFHRGADPLPCNRWNRTDVQGLIAFDVASLRNPASPEPFRSAVLELVDFQPVGGGINLGGRTSCTFKVMLTTASWGGLGFRGPPFVPAAELRSRPRHIVVPDDVGRWSTLVSAEVAEWLRTDLITQGFAIEQSDPAAEAHQVGTCAGHFRFRLNVFLDDH